LALRSSIGGMWLAHSTAMKLFVVVGLLAASARMAGGTYLVELDGGDRMTVDSYWTATGST
jgi:hypothetical protein